MMRAVGGSKDYQVVARLVIQKAELTDSRGVELRATSTADHLGRVRE